MQTPAQGLLIRARCGHDVYVTIGPNSHLLKRQRRRIPACGDCSIVQGEDSAPPPSLFVEELEVDDDEEVVHPATLLPKSSAGAA